jgi:hypothetical protein
LILAFTFGESSFSMSPSKLNPHGSRELFERSDVPDNVVVPCGPTFDLALALIDLVCVAQLRQGFRDQRAFGIRRVCYMEWFRAHFFLSCLARQPLIPL